MPQLTARERTTFEACAETYLAPWQECIPSKPSEALALAARIVAHRDRYEAVQRKTGVPWFFVGIIHLMEGGLNFNKHLHNGDSLKARTVQVPKGRPRTGNPPFTWEVSAMDALKEPPHALHLVIGWSLPRCLYEAERFNGFGQRLYHSEDPSDYLWAGSNIDTPGKYAADGKYDDTLWSKQTGFAVILIQLIAKGHVEFKDDESAPFFE